MSTIISSSSSFHSKENKRLQWKYDVFVSFRGEDTRKSFADHLFAAFKRKGINAFRDDQKLERGKSIGPDLFKAIEESRNAIILFSTNYASSTWCLDELVKIMDCRKNMKQTVYPVFYHVDPWEVRKQAGSFKEPFSKHENAFKDDPEKVWRWRAAITEAANLSGFHLQDRHESMIIDEILKDILSQPRLGFQSSTSDYVGLDWQLKELITSHICLGTDDIQFVGIYGMGGIGKTTLAKLVFDQLSDYFDGSCFLANVRDISSKGDLVSLQKQLVSQILKENYFQIWNTVDGIRIIKSRLCNQKILVIIDDVDHIEQLRNLAGDHSWFGLGSKILITTRDKHVLDAHGVHNIYKVECLNSDDALELFSLKAFNIGNPPQEYSELCQDVVYYANGLPLALEILGSFLRSRKKDEWIGALERFQEDSQKEIIDRLQISFDGLDEKEKSIFLDIAFFFNGENEDEVTKVLEACGFQPSIGIKVLIDRCLIYLSHEGNVLMHDLLREMAQQIVKKESPKDFAKRSRLRSRAETSFVLMKNTEMEAIEGIHHWFPGTEEMKLNAEAFKYMNSLRVLIISGVQLPRGLSHLSNELIYLDWMEYPLVYLPSKFEPKKIVVLCLQHSKIRYLWDGIKPFNKLKIIDMSHSRSLVKTPDFTGVPNLEILVLEGCKALSKVHQSLGDLRRLIVLNLRDCIALVTLPDFNNLASLEVFTVAGCSKLLRFPNIIREMESLQELNLSGTTFVGDFPSSNYRLMKNLKTFILSELKGTTPNTWQFISPCFRIAQHVPSKIHSLLGLHSLVELELSNCNLGEEDFPDHIDGLHSLIILCLHGNNFVNLPRSISRIPKLLELYLDGCKKIKSLPILPSSITALGVSNCPSLESVPNIVTMIFIGGNCFELADKEGGGNVAFALMKTFLQSYSSLPKFSFPLRQPNGSLLIEEMPDFFSAIVPGREIPQWFSNQISEGNSITMEMPPDNEDNELLELSICCIFTNRHNPNIPDYESWLHFAMEGFYLYNLEFLSPQVKGEHVSMHFIDRPSLTLVGNHDRDFSREIKLVILTSCLELQVKRCAIRAVYMKDIEDLQPRKEKRSTLKRNGINAFRDDQKLKRGKSIEPELLKAIEQSKIAIILFSSSYASPTLCLDELVKIMNCRKEMKQIVYPVFYRVDSCVVRTQAGSFNEPFSKHENAFKDDPEKVQRWRIATTDAANLLESSVRD
ncbi:TMV resistance protein N-like [Rutidosis leptorrhynchoides]|uniref:TMV resistance protein N-like n=1 Tax=Rutidosis leptorrhynchoides TaxID=125765 RepID=UPI003A98E81D